ncbi:hypothetical protein D9M71_748410 [compost metagenome]
MLGDRHESRRAFAIEVQQQLVHVQHQGVFFRHCRLIAVDTVDYHGLDVAFVDAAPNPMGKFSGGELGGIHLLDQ